MILCDLDNVLATDRGRDTSRGRPIQRAFLSPPARLPELRASGLPFHVVTAKVAPEARQILRAVGLERHVSSVVGAEALFWPTLWAALRERRLPPTISKAPYARFVPGGGSTHVVMIEDRLANLERMFEAGCIDAGILVPGLRFVEDRLVEGFELDFVLELAAALSRAELAPDQLGAAGVVTRRWATHGLEPLAASELPALLGQAPLLLELPPVPLSGPDGGAIPVTALDTGETLVARDAHAISAVRAMLRLARQLRARLRTLGGH